MNNFKNSKILITGATGLIGSALVKTILREENVKVVALVRNAEKAERVFTDCKSENLEIMVSDICDLKPENIGVDYIIHAASQTSSKAFVNTPVETINTAIKGTSNILEFARVNEVKSLVYLSSMEVYGAPTTDEKISESYPTNLDTMSVRSSYPESKRMCENLCTSYFSEYGVPVKVVRLTQTFGEGVDYNDGRVFAEFARCAIENKDIVLKTKGETKKNYLYVYDAVSAIITVLFNGENGNAYNAANEETYCSIYEMAQMVAEKCGNKSIKVVIEEKDDILKFGYAPTLKMNLSTEKLKNLGWKPKKDLFGMFNVMIDDMIKNKE